MAISYSFEKTELGPHLDVSFPDLVEVEVREDGRVLWVHVDGCTILRICRAGKIEIQEDTMVRQLTAQLRARRTT